MISPINFTGIYTFTKPNIFNPSKKRRKETIKQQDKLLDFLGSLNNIQMAAVGYRKQNNENTQAKYPLYDIRVAVPNSVDSAIEEIARKNNIEYTKISTIEASPDEITQRIAPPPFGKKLVYVNSEKMDTLIEDICSEDSNITDCAYDYAYRYGEQVDDMLKYDEEFPTTTLYIRPSEETFGGYEAVFTRQTESPDHCVYFALKNLGMKKIPVYVDYYTNSICKKIGILND